MLLIMTLIEKPSKCLLWYHRLNKGGAHNAEHYTISGITNHGVLWINLINDTMSERQKTRHPQIELAVSFHWHRLPNCQLICLLRVQRLPSEEKQHLQGRWTVWLENCEVFHFSVYVCWLHGSACRIIAVISTCPFSNCIFLLYTKLLS